MEPEFHNITGWGVERAANIVGVSRGRIGQLCRGENPIDHQWVGQTLVITAKGIKQAQERNKKVGRPLKSIKGSSGTRSRPV